MYDVIVQWEFRGRSYVSSQKKIFQEKIFHREKHLISILLVDKIAIFIRSLTLLKIKVKVKGLVGKINDVVKVP